MFSSNNSANPFPPSIFGHERDDIFLHHQQDLLAGLLLPPNAPPENITTAAVSLSNKAATTKSAKRDRHSKIFTAQGPRDRRVRLSIQIARKFFDLQEMLGFDKPSKTLDWLLTNSKAAIKDLVEMKLGCTGTVAKSLSSTSECEVLSGSNEATDNGDTQRKPPLMSVSKEKIGLLRRQRKAPFHLLSKESRENTRARARERTREKMRIRMLEGSKKLPGSLSPIIWGQIATCKKLGSNGHCMMPSSKVDTKLPVVNEAPRKVIIGKPIYIKGKVKPSKILGREESLINTSKDMSSTSKIYSPHVTENWDFTPTITPANPSTELQDCGKPWEVYNNQTIRD